METDARIFGKQAAASPFVNLLRDPAAVLQNAGAKSHAVTPGFAPDILSASTYPNIPISRRFVKGRPSQQLYGGIVIEGDEDASLDLMTLGEAADANPAPRKRQKRSSKSEEDDSSKKQRGRPRLDTRDETAADRRRTQIRLAQRAYRSRKETTISGLKKRVNELERTIDRMSGSFIQFHDNVIESGLLLSKPALAQQLKETTEDFIFLAKTTAMDSEHEEEENPTVAEAENSESASFSPDQQSSGTFDHQAQRPSIDLLYRNPPLGYEMTFAESSHDSEVEELPPFELSNQFSGKDFSRAIDTASKNWSIINDYQEFRVEVPSPSVSIQTLIPLLERPLKASGPYTYSFQETTLSRRLHRLCLERGFRILTSPDTDPAVTARVFRLTFTFTNKKRLVARFQELLKRKAGENLENWNVPFVRIGGAGTHFPRRDDQGNPVYPPNVVSAARAIGPMQFSVVETPREAESTEQLLEALGLGGEWFDAHDVEEYLKTKGINVDGHSSFVEIDPFTMPPPLVAATSASTASSNSSGSPLQRPPTPEYGRGAQIGADVFSAQELPDPFGPDGLFMAQDKLLDYGEVDGMGPRVWDQQMDLSDRASAGYSPSFQDIVYRSQHPLTLDVGKLLDRMVDGSACLGRAPGFRRKDVDNALVMALQEAF